MLLAPGFEDIKEGDTVISSESMTCRGTWDLLVPCPFYHNLPRLPPQNLYRICTESHGDSRGLLPQLEISARGPRQLSGIDMIAMPSLQW